jgi:hypothetical protein
VSTPAIVSSLYIEDAMVRENLSMGGFDLHVLSHRGPTSTGVVKPIPVFEIENVPRGQMPPNEPMMNLPYKSAQIIFDALYKAGFRPSSGEATESHQAALAATRAHLNDMRAIAMKHVGLDLTAQEEIHINTLALEKTHEKATW